MTTPSAPSNSAQQFSNQGAASLASLIDTATAQPTVPCIQTVADVAASAAACAAASAAKEVCCGILFFYMYFTIFFLSPCYRMH